MFEIGHPNLRNVLKATIFDWHGILPNEATISFAGCFVKYITANNCLFTSPRVGEDGDNFLFLDLEYGYDRRRSVDPIGRRGPAHGVKIDYFTIG